jgi:hypothetical protein
MAEVPFNPAIDKYFTVQGFVVDPKGAANIAHRKYNVIDLRKITLEQAVELYREKTPYLIPTEEGIKYLKETKEATASQISESEQQLKEASATEKKK